MENLKKMNEIAWKDMMNIDPPKWARSHYNTSTQRDL